MAALPSHWRSFWDPPEIADFDGFTNLGVDGWNLLARDMRVWASAESPKIWCMEPLPVELWTRRWKQARVPSGATRVFYRGRFDLEVGGDGELLGKVSAEEPDGFCPDAVASADVEPPTRAPEAMSPWFIERRRLGAARWLFRHGLDPLLPMRRERELLAAATGRSASGPGALRL